MMVMKIAAPKKAFGLVTPPKLAIINGIVMAPKIWAITVMSIVIPLTLAL